MWAQRVLQLLLPAVLRPRLAWSAAKIMVAALCLGLGFWVLDAWVDARQGQDRYGVGAMPTASVWEQVFLPPPLVLVQRGAVLAACLCTGLVAVWWVARFRSYHRDLSRSERRLALALDQAGLAVWEFDPRDGRTVARARWQPVFGLPDDSAGNLGEMLAAQASTTEYAAALTMVRQCLAGSAHARYCDYPLRRPDGQTVWIRERVTLVECSLEGQPARVMRTFQNVTAERQAEDERLKLLVAMERGQKLESLGAMAGQIAHDFRNYLTAVLGGAEAAAVELRAGSLGARALEDIRVAVRQATGLCRQLLNYGGTASGEEHPIELCPALAELRGMLKMAVGGHLDVSLEAGPDLWICMDPTQLGQALLNLVINAAEAMRGRTGTIRITAAPATGLEDRGAGYVLGDHLGPGPHCLIQVRDQGCGMDETAARRLFEPFFSTKAHGRGLGLATVLGIVRRHQGAVRVDSRPGQGTCVSLVLPLVSCPDSAPEGSSAPHRVAASRLAPAGDLAASEARRLVVVADHDESVRRTTGRLLVRLGFEAVPVASGAEALAYCAASPARVSCVLLDLGRPYEEDIQVVRDLRRRHPAIPVVLMTGSAPEVSTAELAACGPVTVLTKPFEVEALDQVLRECTQATD